MTPALLSRPLLVAADVKLSVTSSVYDCMMFWALVDSFAICMIQDGVAVTDEAGGIVGEQGHPHETQRQQINCCGCELC